MANPASGLALHQPPATEMIVNKRTYTSVIMEKDMDTALSVTSRRGMTLEEIISREQEVLRAIRTHRATFGRLYNDLFTPLPSATPLDVWVKRLKFALSAYDGIKGVIHLMKNAWKTFNVRQPTGDTPSR